MGAYTYLEVDYGNTISVTDERGAKLGKGLDAFLTVYSTIEYLGKESPELRWFERLENASGGDIRVLTRIIYSGDWNYTTKDYDKFSKDYVGYLPLSEEDFIRTIKKIEETWESIDVVNAAVNELLDLLEPIEGETHWFSPVDTTRSFKVLRDALQLAPSRGAKKVRLNFR